MRSAWAFDMPSVESHLRFTALVISEHHVRSAGMQSLSVPFRMIQVGGGDWRG
jgi:hypothetical protein